MIFIWTWQVLGQAKVCGKTSIRLPNAERQVEIELIYILPAF